MASPFTPATTPLSLKVLLLTTFLLSITSTFTGPYLALTSFGIAQLYLWQFVTYLFVHPFPSGILHLAFNLYLVWTFGASLIQRISPKHFFSLYFGSGIVAALCAWLAMYLFHPAPLAGSSSALYAILTAWVILNPEAQLLLFFSIPVKARHLLLALIGFNLLIDLSRSDWIPLFAYLGAVVFGYLFIIASCRIRSSFSFLAGFENGILRTIEKLTHFRKKPIKHAKIYDIKSGEPVLSDEQFMDAMLSRISLYGEETLTPEEKKRMQKISEKKARI